MREADIVVGFNEMEIEAERLVLIKARDRFRQERKHQRSKAGRQRPLWKQQLPSLPEPKPENYLPMKSRSFWPMLRRSGVRWLHKHNCPVHQDYPILKAKLDIIRHRIAELEIIDNAAEPISSELEAELFQKRVDEQTWTRKLAEYDRHMEQYLKCRPKVKEIRDNLVDDQAIVMRDWRGCGSRFGVGQVIVMRDPKLKWKAIVMRGTWFERLGKSLECWARHNQATECESFGVAGVGGEGAPRGHRKSGRWWRRPPPG